MFDLAHRQFTQADVVTVTGTTEKNLQNWTSRHVLKVTDQNPGRPRRRLYNGFDVIKVQVMLDLTSLGIAAAFAGRFADKIVAERAKEIEADYEGANVDADGVPLEAKDIIIRIVPGDPESRVLVFKGAQRQLAMTMAEALDPRRQTYLHIEVDRLILDVLRRLMPLVYDDVPDDDASGSEGEPREM